MREPLGLAKLKADVVPGDYGFDPLNLMPKDEKKYVIRDEGGSVSYIV
tara:strand:+ start:246 stop:389 length:144 start_codon:yes stop_codon:yes gene_type:complete